jgi:hypothetical protein
VLNKPGLYLLHASLTRSLNTVFRETKLRRELSSEAAKLVADSNLGKNCDNPDCGVSWILPALHAAATYCFQLYHNCEELCLLGC